MLQSKIIPVVDPPASTDLRPLDNYQAELQPLTNASKVRVAGAEIRTIVVQTFANDSDKVVSGTYIYQFSFKRAPDSFVLKIDGEPAEGHIVAANGESLFARVEAIRPHGSKKIELQFTERKQAGAGGADLHRKNPSRINPETRAN